MVYHLFSYFICTAKKTKARQDSLSANIPSNKTGFSSPSKLSINNNVNNNEATGSVRVDIADVVIKYALSK